MLTFFTPRICISRIKKTKNGWLQQTWRTSSQVQICFYICLVYASGSSNSSSNQQDDEEPEEELEEGSENYEQEEAEESEVDEEIEED